MVPADHPTELRRRCEEEAQQMVQMRMNSLKDGQQSVTNPSLTHLISRLTALLLQIKVKDAAVCFLRHKYVGMMIRYVELFSNFFKISLNYNA